MGLKETVLWVLRAGIATGIRFSFIAPSGIDVEVNNTTFLRIINKIESNDLFLDDNPVHINSPSAAAEYHALNIANNSNLWNRFWSNQYSGVIVIPPGIGGTFRQGAIIHESVHASFDLTHSDFPMLEEEAAAYIAGAFYYKASGYYFNSNASIFGKAQRIVESVTMTPQTSPIIPTASVGELVVEIGSQSAYKGCVGHNSYLHNG